MSLLPGEITKQSLVAPPRTMRSTRYSLTARGRSTAPSTRMPTGKSSLEKASGWIRLPMPAAGMIPHTSSSHQRQQLFRPLLGGVLAKRPLPRRVPDPGQVFRWRRDGGHRLGGSPGDEDFLPRAEEPI